MRLAAAAFCALSLAAPALAAPAVAAPTAPVYDGQGNLVETSFAPDSAKPQLSEREATARFVANPKVAAWLGRYPPDPQTDAEYERDEQRWTVKAWSGDAGQIALGKVDDASGAVTEAWTGPQVAWKMARGYDGAFGGKTLNSVPVWLGFCLVFLLGLADLRRPFALRNLDLLALLSFSISLWFFDRGEIFWSAPLALPPLLYLIGRLGWIGARGRRPAAHRPVWPVWALAAATVFLLGFRVGLNVEAPYSVIDVGYAGVIGAHRIANGEAPYGHFPIQGDRPACGPADAEGEIRNRVQTNGRCESSNDRGDTYGPVSYLAYLPGYWLFGWSGKWPGDTLPAVHFTSIAFDLLAVVGMALVGFRFGGGRLAATLAFAWAAYPFTQYASNTNSNDAIPAVLLLFGFWLVTSPWTRGAAVAAAGWAKFAALIVAPLWIGYRRGEAGRAAVGFLLSTVAAFLVLLLEPDLVDAVRTFAERTLLWQLDRESPFSVWGWGQYEAEGIPDLKPLQRVLQGVLVVTAIAVAFVPRRPSPLQLAALTGALIAGVQLVLTHWFYLYIPWFFPFAAFALLTSAPVLARRRADEERREGDARELVAAG